LGYLISKHDLNDNNINVYETGFKALVRREHLDKSFVLGNKSLGALFEDAGYTAVPSPKHTSPGRHILVALGKIGTILMSKVYCFGILALNFFYLNGSDL
jgi:hypothetical protein